MTPKIEDFIGKENIAVKTETVNGHNFTIVSYIFNDNELWHDAINYEARGITFDSNGKIIMRPFEKFHNLNGHNTTQYKDLDFTDSTFYNKKDGSMITGTIIDNQLFFKTKKSFYSEVAQFCQRDFGNDQRYIDLIKECQKADLTPIFEYTSPNNRIVIDYGNEPQLTLLAIRDNISGSYATKDMLKLYSTMWSIPLIELYDNMTIIDALNESKKIGQNVEGFVVELKSGQRVKIKYDEYLAKHGTLERFNAKNIATMVIDEIIDDFKVLIDPARLGVVEAIENTVLMEFDIIRNVVYNLYQKWYGMELRDIGKQYSDHPQFHPAIQIFKGKDDTEVLKKYFKSFRIEQYPTTQLW